MGKLGFFLLVIMVSVVVISLIVNVHLFTVINRLNEVFFLKLLPQDRAVEISRKTTRVQDALNHAAEHGYNRSSFEPNVDYWNADKIESYIQTYRSQDLTSQNWYGKLSEGYGIWRISWYISSYGGIIHYIDENTGEILLEERLQPWAESSNLSHAYSGFYEEGSSYSLPRNFYGKLLRKGMISQANDKDFPRKPPLF